MSCSLHVPVCANAQALQLLVYTVRHPKARCLEGRKTHKAAINAHMKLYTGQFAVCPAQAALEVKSENL
jgi:hypothetical protein